MTLATYALTAFTTLLVVIDPVAVFPLYLGLLGGVDQAKRRAIGRRAVMIAFGVAIFFLVGGRLLLTSLGVSVDAFKISGGILLFLTALPMLFGGRGQLMSPGEDEGKAADDVAVFPLAIPLISGPGTLTTVLTLEAAAQGSMGRQVALVIALVLVFGITAMVLRFGSGLVNRLGESGVHIVTRVLGIILAALAAQFVLDGASHFVRTAWPR